MTNIVTILRERFPRLVDAVLGAAPEAVHIHVATIALDEKEATELREALSLVPADKIERVTDALLKFGHSLLSAFVSLFSDVGPDDMALALAFIAAKAAREKRVEEKCSTGCGLEVVPALMVCRECLDRLAPLFRVN